VDFKEFQSNYENVSELHFLSSDNNLHMSLQEIIKMTMEKKK